MFEIYGSVFETGLALDTGLKLEATLFVFFIQAWLQACCLNWLEAVCNVTVVVSGLMFVGFKACLCRLTCFCDISSMYYSALLILC